MIAVDSIRDVKVDDRLRGAVWGQFVGDAAALGTHWIYDLDELSSKFPRGVMGFETPMEGHYHFGKKSAVRHLFGGGPLSLRGPWPPTGGLIPGPSEGPFAPPSIPGPSLAHSPSPPKQHPHIL